MTEFENVVIVGLVECMIRKGWAQYGGGSGRASWRVGRRVSGARSVGGAIERTFCGYSAVIVAINAGAPAGSALGGREGVVCIAIERGASAAQTSSSSTGNHVVRDGSGRARVWEMIVGRSKIVSR